MHTQTLANCGNGKCEGIETCYNCPTDCNDCPIVPVYKCQDPGHYTLTFDDGPSENTHELLDILKAHQIHATFFVIGNKLNDPANKKTLRRAFDEGHSIGSHTYNHARLTEKSDEQIVDELNRTQALISETIDKKQMLVRTPYLFTDLRVETAIRKLGMLNVLMTIDSLDWSLRSSNPEQISRGMLWTINSANIKKDSVISMFHDTTNPKMWKMPIIIKAIRDKGFRIVDMNTCLGLTSSYIKEVTSNITSNITTHSIENNLPVTPKTPSNLNSTGVASNSKLILAHLNFIFILASMLMFWL